ncbi:hypothetical protein Pla108_26140 [Botrimarina colliarenosi]|uniref:VWFA domain-containing protein n=1 Tax=Botrimarina colliarenosi TaxID=2528001 RepID=A0A5C6ABR1_9BACT|nr:hypothetical protein [Botrimarina colliarenosi]TWT96840.1 hypothetical protein Pla108_26140 [Botrimarina colliarenosi]
MPVEADRRATALAWGTSLAVHTLLSAGVFYYGSQGGSEAGGDAPTREIGVVLRQSEQPPSPFESDSLSDADTPVPVEIAPIEPSPTESVSLSPSPFSELLEQLVEPKDPGAGPQASPGGASAPAPPPSGGGRPKLPIGQARVPFLGVEGVGSRFVYVLDRSTSMQGGPLRAVKAHLVASLDAIGPPQQFHILFFNTRVSALDLTGGQNRIAFGTDENKRRAAKYVLSVTADGGTERKVALEEAIAFRPDVIFFLTDDDTPMTANQLDQIVDEASGAVTIHTIEFGKGPNHGRRNFLGELAAQTGGQHAYVDTTRLPR